MRSVRRRQWSAGERAAVIAVVTIVTGSLFVAGYSLALGDPVPHRIDGGLVGSRTSDARTVSPVEEVGPNRLVFHRFASVPAALHAIDEQDVYAVLDLTSSRPTLYVAGAAGSSVARLLERIDAMEPTVRGVDSRPVASNDPNGLDIFYLMLVATIIGFMTVFQVRTLAGNLEQHRHVSVVLGLASWERWFWSLSTGRCCITVRRAPTESSGGSSRCTWWPWGSCVLDGSAGAPWAVLPTWLFFVILGNASSGGPVSPPLLREPFGFLSQWLPSGATVTALRNAVYFRGFSACAANSRPWQLWRSRCSLRGYS